MCNSYRRDNSPACTESMRPVADAPTIWTPLVGIPLDQGRRSRNYDQQERAERTPQRCRGHHRLRSFSEFSFSPCQVQAFNASDLMQVPAPCECLGCQLYMLFRMGVKYNLNSGQFYSSTSHTTNYYEIHVQGC